MTPKPKRYWITCEVPRLLHLQFKVWCAAEQVDERQRMTDLLFQAMAADDKLGRRHLESMGPRTQDWLQIMKRCGWEEIGNGTIKRKRSRKKTGKRK